MKNSTTALVLFLTCLIGSIVSIDSTLITSASIFVATLLIINTIDKDK